MKLADLRAARVGLEARSVVDHIDLGHWRAARETGPWQPIERGEPWPEGEGPVAFERHTVTVPPEWPLAHVRLALAPGGPGRALVHSKHGRVAFDLAPAGSPVPVPALAFGLRLEAQAVAAGAPLPARFGGAQLERLDAEIVALAATLDDLAEAWARAEGDRANGARGHHERAERLAAGADAVARVWRELAWVQRPPAPMADAAATSDGPLRPIGAPDPDARARLRALDAELADVLTSLDRDGQRVPPDDPAGGGPQAARAEDKSAEQAATSSGQVSRT